MQEYKGIEKIVVHNSDLSISSRFKLKPWKNFLPYVSLDEVVTRVSAKDEKEVIVKDGSLVISNARTKISVPYGRRTSVEAYDGSNVSGKFIAGHLKTDATSEIDLDVPWRVSRNIGSFGSTMESVAEDLLYIGLATVAVGIVGSLTKYVGMDPANYWGVYALIAAGMNVGIRGASKRLLLTTLAVAGLSTLGPEFKETLVNGVESGLQQLGGEDLLKIGTYLASFGLGDVVKKHYRRKTA